MPYETFWRSYASVWSYAPCEKESAKLKQPILVLPQVAVTLYYMVSLSFRGVFATIAEYISSIYPCLPIREQEVKEFFSRNMHEQLLAEVQFYYLSRLNSSHVWRHFVVIGQGKKQLCSQPIKKVCGLVDVCKWLGIWINLMCKCPQIH